MTTPGNVNAITTAIANLNEALTVFAGEAGSVRLSPLGTERAQALVDRLHRADTRLAEAIRANGDRRTTATDRRIEEARAEIRHVLVELGRL